MIRSVLFLCFVCGLVLAQGSSSPCNAVAIDLSGGNATVFGNTIGSHYFAPSVCNNADAGTSWYSVTPASGSHVVVSTCGDYTNFDTYLGVYSGSCDALTCVEANDDSDCPRDSGSFYSSWYWSSFVASIDEVNYDPVDTRSDPSTVQFVADGSTYYVSVSGDHQEEGKFALSVLILGDNAGCAAATKIPGPYMQGPVSVNTTLTREHILGSTSCSRLDFDDAASWFTIFPEPGHVMNVTTCNSGTQFDTRMAILSGDCNDLECIYENDDDSCGVAYDSSTIRFLPTLSEYLVVVTSFSQSHVGEDFVLSVSQEIGSIDPGCAGAIPITINNYVNPEVSTVNVPSLENSYCGNEEGPAVWFKIRNGRHAGEATFDTCSPVTDFDTVLSVYQGTCSTLQCKPTYSSGACGSAVGPTKTSVSVALDPQETVYVVVTGVNGATGNVQLLTSFVEY